MTVSSFIMRLNYGISFALSQEISMEMQRKMLQSFGSLNGGGGGFVGVGGVSVCECFPRRLYYSWAEGGAPSRLLPFPATR